MLLKRASRLSKKYWHSRYFVFSPDNTLHYYKEKPGTRTEHKSKCRGSFHISDLTGTEVSDLFVQKQNKKLIYCLRVSFANLHNGEHDDDDDDDFSDMDEHSLSSDEHDAASALGHGGASSSLPPPRVVVQDSAAPAAPASVSLARPKPLTSNHHRSQSSASYLNTPTRKNKQQHKRQQSTATARSIDGESLTLGSRLRGAGRHRRWGSRSITAANKTTASMKSGNKNEGDDHHEPPVPESIHVAQTPIPPVVSSNSNNNPNRNILAKSHRRNEEEEEQDYLRTQYLAAEKQKERRLRQKVAQGTKLAAAAGATVGVAFFTAGVGIVAGAVALAIAGAAGGGGAAVNSRWGRKTSGEIVLASEDYETAKLWKSILDAALESDHVQQSTWGQIFATDGRKARSALLPNRSIQRAVSHGGGNNSVAGGGGASPKDGLLFANNARWRAVEGGLLALIGSGYQGLRIYREEFSSLCETMSEGGSRIINQISVDGKPCPPMKAHTVISTSPLHAFLCLMSHGRVLNSDQKYCAPNVEHRASFEMIENIDEHTDIIHMVFQPLFLFPAWAKSRDFVLFRYWRLEPDGSYVVCFESVDHAKRLPSKEHVRGEMHAVFNIAPLKKVAAAQGHQAVHSERVHDDRNGASGSERLGADVQVVHPVEPDLRGRLWSCRLAATGRYPRRH